MMATVEVVAAVRRLSWISGSGIVAVIIMILQQCMKVIVLFIKIM